MLGTRRIEEDVRKTILAAKGRNTPLSRAFLHFLPDEAVLGRLVEKKVRSLHIFQVGYGLGNAATYWDGADAISRCYTFNNRHASS